MSQEDYSRFQIWIESMSDEEYESWLEDDATDKQESKALEFRAEPETEIERELEIAQGDTQVSVSRNRIGDFFRRLFGR